MNRITERIRALYRPKAALIAYECIGKHNSGYFLELRPINSHGVMGEAIPVTYKFINKLTDQFSEAYSGTPAGAIPGNLLFANTKRGSEKYIWYNPPCKRMMYFVPQLGIENAEYHLPGIVYIASETGLMIYAYKGKISEKAELFNAPFFNCSNGNICLGVANIKKPANPGYHELMEYWERKFWLTEFSHLGGGGNPTKNNLVLVTKAAKDKDFNLDQLKPASKKLKDILT